MAQAAHKTCEICMRASGLYYCTQCDQVFCDDCKISHLRSKSSRNHFFMDGTNINTEEKVGCTDHGEDFVYLCEDCEQLICRLCVTKAHARHALVDIKDSNKKVQTEISTYLDSKVENVRSSAQLIEERTKMYETEVEATMKVIMEQGNAIKVFVDKKVDALIKVVRERESIELKYLSTANKDCRDLLGEVTRQQQIYQDMIKQCDEVVLFQKMKKIKSDIDDLKTVDVARLRLPSAKYNRKTVNFSDVEKLFGNLNLQETEVTAKKTKQAAKAHDQPKQPTQEKKKDLPPISNTERHELRVVLIGQTGVGKSALGNTLLGEKRFKSSVAIESVTKQWEASTGTLPSGRIIKVVDTPGIINTEGSDVCDEVNKAIASLSPGPHAFIIVLQPGRSTEEQKRMMITLKKLFGDETFLKHTILVMTKKEWITDENDDPIDIHDYIDQMAPPYIKQLYEQCGRRIVAVENKHSSQDEKNKYAKEVTEEVLKIGGYYKHAYFKLSMEKKIQAVEITKLRREIERVANEQKETNCTIQ